MSFKPLTYTKFTGAIPTLLAMRFTLTEESLAEEVSASMSNGHAQLLPCTTARKGASTVDGSRAAEPVANWLSNLTNDAGAKNDSAS